MKKNYKVLKPIGYSGRREKGEIVLMDEDTAKAFGPEYLAEVETTEEKEAEQVEEKEVDDMSIAELKQKAKELGLSIVGSKADLVERIKVHLA